MNVPYVTNCKIKVFSKYLMKSSLIFSIAITSSINVANASGIAQVSTSLNGASLLGQEMPTELLTFKTWLKPSNQQELKLFLSNLYNPSSPEYHKFISSSEYTQKFGTSTQDISSVKNYLVNKGFTVTNVAGNGAYIEAIGSVAKIQQTFNTQINNYLTKNGKVAYSNDRAITLDQEINDKVSVITGLDNVSKMHPQYVATGTLPNAVGMPGTMVPQLMQKAYGVDKLHASGLNGSGQTIAIVDAYDDATIENDLNVFSSRYNLPTCTNINGCFTKLNQYGELSPLPESFPAEDDWSGEISLDVQSAHTIIPGARIILIEANSNNNDDLYAAINTVVSKQLASVISNSYGGAETPDSPLEYILMQAAAQGISVNFSSGDTGDNVGSQTSTPSVDYPSSSPWATAVGGTKVQLNSNGSYKYETGWAWPWEDVGSTGGLSQYYTAQSWQQQAISTVNAAGYGPVGSRRAVPDISLDGDPFSGFPVYDTADGTAWRQIGGTSLACPLYSSLIVIANQARAAKQIPTVGLTTPYLYKMSYSQHQGSAPITNIVAPKYTQSSVLGANPGWNDITGLGSPYGPLFIQYLVNNR
jgi:subtilase family serine protease